jgi:hypothetical protein
MFFFYLQGLRVLCFYLLLCFLYMARNTHALHMYCDFYIQHKTQDKNINPGILELLNIITNQP